ncbi:MAG TPA: hypothetical protein ENH11_07840 [Candidatus Acetothermia bacterium]|nr:hypothetical protein [Candidatus Acetothermia bacterium]
MSNKTLSTKVPEKLRQQVDEIASIEKRAPSSIVRLAIEHYVNTYFELHPQFKADILEARAAMRDGDVEDYEFG